MLFKRNTEDFVYIGKKKVEVKKLPVKQWRQIFGVLDQLPGVIFSVIANGNSQGIGALVIAAVDVCFDEVVEIIAIVSGLDKAYIEENAALDEIVDYIEKLVEKNNFEATLKKLQTAGSRLFQRTPEKANPQA